MLFINNKLICLHYLYYRSLLHQYHNKQLWYWFNVCKEYILEP